jgi:hypothetical protein
VVHGIIQLERVLARIEKVPVTATAAQTVGPGLRDGELDEDSDQHPRDLKDGAWVVELK